MKRFTTRNSVYVIDEEDMRYMRMPKQEKPRSAEERQRQEESGKLADCVWLPLREWQIETDFYTKEKFLRLYAPDSVHGVMTSSLEEGQCHSTR